MQVSRNNKLRWLSAALLGVLSAAPTSAWALGSAEGAQSDLGPYFTRRGQEWFFYHTLGNVDNELILQYNGGSADLNPVTGRDISIVNGAGVIAPVTISNFGFLADGFYNVLPTAAATGAGIILEVVENMNVGLWLSTFSPGTGQFVNRGVAATGWLPSGGPVVDELTPNDAFLNGGLGLEAGRKMDLFLSYWLPDMGVEAGVHLWYGSASNKLMPDDSIGPININEPSDPTIVIGSTTSEDVKQSVFGLRDFGFGFSGGYTKMENLRADVGVEFGFTPITWSPNSVSDYLSAGGNSQAVNLRAHYKLSTPWTVGGFVRFARRANSFEPKLQRDGGNLKPFFNPTGDAASSLPDPSRANLPFGDPANPNNEQTPVEGIAYKETEMDWQAAVLTQFTPRSWVNIYGALGVGALSATNKVSVKEDWYDEQAFRLMAMPFINVGFEGAIFSHLSMFGGVTKRWQKWRGKHHAFDSRIPDNGDAQGPVGTAVTPGNEDNTNANRRDIEEWQTIDVSQNSTKLFVGTRIHYNGVQLIGQLNPAVLINGLNFLSGATVTPMWFYVNLVYDWDWDADFGSGNGAIIRAHTAERDAAPVAPASTSGSGAGSRDDAGLGG